jgi:ferredoxin
MGRGESRKLSPLGLSLSACTRAKSDQALQDDFCPPHRQRRATGEIEPARARGLVQSDLICQTKLSEVAYTITQPCIGLKDASCVEVCPVDCIHSDDASDQYFIDPDECIDCGACVDPCPVDAIYPEDEVPEEWRGFIQINTDYFKK